MANDANAEKTKKKQTDSSKKQKKDSSTNGLPKKQNAKKAQVEKPLVSVVVMYNIS